MDQFDLAGDAVEVGFLAVLEADNAVLGGKEGVVRALHDVDARENAGAALADNNAAGLGVGASRHFNTKPLPVGIAAERCRASCFFMCHTMGDWGFECRIWGLVVPG